MKTSIGGDRLGSGNKQNISLRNYERSTHDLSYLWRSSMSAGTLVPFMSELALPGDSWDIDLNCEVMTLPTVGPLFGSYKVQLDVFQIPIRIYNAALHMNRLGIGMDMSQIALPQMAVRVNNHANYVHTYEDNSQINPSCILAYLGIRGIGQVTGETNPAYRLFNAVPFLGYWDIYKNYYANKQEEVGYAIHIDDNSETVAQSIVSATLNDNGTDYFLYENPTVAIDLEAGLATLTIYYGINAEEPIMEEIEITRGGVKILASTLWETWTWDNVNKTVTFTNFSGDLGSYVYEVEAQSNAPVNPIEDYGLLIEDFPLSNIDDMREEILQYPWNGGAFEIGFNSVKPYSMPFWSVGSVNDETRKYSCQFSQEGLGLKTYQSDLFNNWISTEWIDGTNGISEVTSVSTAGDSFTIDALNIAQKVYNMLNRIAISGGTYDDWLDAVYTHERAKSVESPVYMGSLIKELAFEEVISNSSQSAETSSSGENEPLGQLAGRGRLTQKNKGGQIKVKVDEPSYIMGIVSLTPRVDYSQGNKWDMNLRTMNDLHKPALDAIGYQDLITEQMVWSDTELTDNDTFTFKSAGKQPAWINYMTAVNRVYGNFAIASKEMFMTLNRRYEINSTTGAIEDLTTYIDPTKFNHIFADTRLDAQNFWVQISNNITARRKMSAKVIPNL